MKRWGRSLTFPLSAVLTLGGSGFVQSSLHEALSHGCIVPSFGDCLGNHIPQAFPRLWLLMGRVCVFCQLISLAGMGTGSDSKDLRLKGAESTLDCPSPHIHCGHAGLPDASIGKRGYLGMIPGWVE